MSRRCLPLLPSLRPTLFLASSLLIASSFASCTPCEPIAPLKPDPPPQVTPPPPPKPTGPTEADARTFMNETETQLRALWSYAQRVQFVQNTNITFDTEQLNAQSQEQVMELVGKKIKEAAKFDKLELPPDLRRKFDLLKLAQDLPSPADAGERAELAQLAASMETTYGKAKYCPPRLKGGCLTLDDLSRTLSTSRNYDELMEAWVGWHDLAKTLRGSYVRYVVLANKGAQNAGYADVGAMWRSRYDMPEDAFAAETERLWEQVKPLYEALHCYTRMKLRQTYGNRVPESGPIPAHLLGNMWAQEWGNIFPLVAPTGKGAAINLKSEVCAEEDDSH
ncbi:MAG: M2 family metallopeptidase [Polyangia bacterium]